MNKAGTLVFKGKRFLCTRCGEKMLSLEVAEEHRCAEQEQESPDRLGEEAYPENKRDAMYHMRLILTKRVPRD